MIKKISIGQYGLHLSSTFCFFVNKNVKKINKNMTSNFYFIIENGQKKDQKIKFR